MKDKIYHAKIEILFKVERTWLQSLVDWKQDAWEDIKAHFLKDP